MYFINKDVVTVEIFENASEEQNNSHRLFYYEYCMFVLLVFF